MMAKKQDIVDKLGLNEQQLKKLAKQINSRPQKENKPYSFDGDHVRFIATGDSHMGHKDFNQPLWDAMAERANQDDIDFVLHTGDVCEGWYTQRQGHVFELTHLGYDQQVDFALENFSKINKDVYFITGNHTANTFWKMAGVDIGQTLEDRLERMHYLGCQHGSIELPYGHKVEMRHPDGGTAYAISYKTQKMVEALEGGTKPAVLLIGQFHKAEYLFYRNVHCVQTATTCGQTPFMRNKGIAAHEGFWDIDMAVDKNGVTRFQPTYYPAYGNGR